MSEAMRSGLTIVAGVRRGGRLTAARARPICSVPTRAPFMRARLNAGAGALRAAAGSVGRARSLVEEGDRGRRERFVVVVGAGDGPMTALATAQLSL